jgi:hypothetical protein
MHLVQLSFKIYVRGPRINVSNSVFTVNTVEGRGNHCIPNGRRPEFLGKLTRVTKAETRKVIADQRNRVWQHLCTQDLVGGQFGFTSQFGNENFSQLSGLDALRKVEDAEF